MVKEWKRSISEEDIVSDGTAFDGANLDAPISSAGASKDVQTHDLRFVTQMSRLFFDRGRRKIGYTSGDYQIFTDVDGITNDYISHPYSLEYAGSTSENYTPSNYNDDPCISVADNGSVLILGDDGGNFKQYSMSTPYDLSTAEFTNNTFSTTDEDSNPEAMALKPDGTKLFIAGEGTDTAYAYDLSTAFDITTATYNGESTTGEGRLQKIAFSDGGSTLYLSDNGNAVWQYSLSTPYDISTAGSLVGSAGLSYTSGMSISDDGTAILMYDRDIIYEFEMSTPHDVTTASKVLEYHVGVLIPWPGTYSSPNVTAGDVANGGDYLYLSDKRSGYGVRLLDLRENNSPVFVTGVDGQASEYVPYEYSRARYTENSYSVTGLEFGEYQDNGNLFFYSDFGSDWAKLELTTPYDLTTATEVQRVETYSYSTFGSTPTTGTVKDGGGKLYESGYIDGAYRMLEIDMTGYDLTSSFSEADRIDWQNNYPVTEPGTLVFDEDGSKLITRYSSYDLDTAWNITPFTENEYPTPIENGSHIDVADSGELLFSKPGNSGWVSVWRLSTPYDPTTRELVGEIHTKAIEGRYISVADDGSRIAVGDYVTGGGSQEITTTKLGYSNPDTVFTDNLDVGYTPTTAIVEHSTSDVTVSYDITDGDGNTVSVSDSQVGSEVDVSSFTAPPDSVTVSISRERLNKDAGLDDFAIYFD